MTRPDIATDLAWCSCGKRIWGHDRTEFAAEWYSHLADMARQDPDGDHRLPRAEVAEVVDRVHREMMPPVPDGGLEKEPF